MIELADDVLGADGRLLAALKAMGPAVARGYDGPARLDLD
jgi:hypothetical protein